MNLIAVPVDLLYFVTNEAKAFFLFISLCHSRIIVLLKLSLLCVTVEATVCNLHEVTFWQNSVSYGADGVKFYAFLLGL